MSPGPFPRDFYRGDPREVAPKLLGKLLCRRLGGEILAGLIVEVEAYLPSGDLAAHQQRGKTPATRSLYGEPGTTYVHRMRQHHLLDVVTGPAGEAGSVLIRALEPLQGLATMAKNRGTTDPARLATGPGRLCQALAIDKNLDGYDLTTPDGQLWLAAPPEENLSFEIAACIRIGITRSTDLALRFVVAGSRFLSLPIGAAADPSL